MTYVISVIRGHKLPLITAALGQSSIKFDLNVKHAKTGRNKGKGQLNQLPFEEEPVFRLSYLFAWGLVTGHCGMFCIWLGEKTPDVGCPKESAGAALGSIQRSENATVGSEACAWAAAPEVTTGGRSGVGGM